jgi:hypothetical protein
MWSEDQEADGCKMKGSSWPPGECQFSALCDMQLCVSSIGINMAPSAVTSVVFSVSACRPRFCYFTALIEHILTTPDPVTHS